jgi:shikimate dehydrogenase
MHNAALTAAGIRARYEAWDVPEDELAEIFAGAADRGLGGLNVTVPHKVAAAGLCDELSEAAGLAGAVNTVVFGARITGHNTDVSALAGIVGEWATGRGGSGGRTGFRVGILGAGGAARAAAVAAVLAGAGEVTLAAREAGRAVSVAGDLRVAVDLRAAGRGRVGGPGGVRFRSVALAELATREAVDVLVQATSAPDGALAFVPPLGRGGLAIELNYRPARTRFLLTAEAAGAKTADGLEVLLRQGEEAFHLFTGQRPRPGVMRRALAAAVGEGWS